jgi:hypothetical protein
LTKTNRLADVVCYPFIAIGGVAQAATRGVFGRVVVARLIYTILNLRTVTIVACCEDEREIKIKKWGHCRGGRHECDGWKLGGRRNKLQYGQKGGDFRLLNQAAHSIHVLGGVGANCRKRDKTQLQ